MNDRSHGPTAGRAIGRRRVLAVGASVAGVSLAGCSAIADFLGDMILKDVNVFNGTESAITGTIEVSDPAGDVVLDERFDVPGADDDGNESEGNESGGNESEADAESMGLYADVFTDAGEYAVSLSLDEEIGGESERSESVEVADAEEEHLVIFVGADDADESIVVAVVEGISDLSEYDDEFAG